MRPLEAVGLKWVNSYKFSILVRRKNFNFNFWKIWSLKIFFNIFLLLFYIKSKLGLWSQEARIIFILKAIIWTQWAPLHWGSVVRAWKVTQSENIKVLSPLICTANFRPVEHLNPWKVWYKKFSLHQSFYRSKVPSRTVLY